MGVIALTARGVKTNQGWAVSGAASIPAALADGSDTSYITPGSGFLVSDFNDITTQLPNLAQIRSARMGIRVAATSGSNGSISVGWDVRLINGTTPFQQLIKNLKPGSSPSQWWFPWSPYAPDKTRWNLSGINAAEISMLASAGIKVYETYFQVQYNEAPVTTVTGPSGTVKDDATPIVTWLFSDPDGDLQERWQVRIYTVAQTLVAGFSPDSTTPWWDSASMWSRAPSSTSVQVPNPMPPGSYVVYVRTSDAGSNGRWGLWASSSFTLTGQPPAPPTCTVAVDPANQRTAITVHALDNLLSREESASMDDLAAENWSYVVTNGSIARTTVGGTDTTLAISAVGNGTSPWRATSANRYYIQAGATYTALATFIKNTTARTCRVGIAFFDNTGTQIGSTSLSANVTNTTTGAQASVTVTAPVGSVTAAQVLEIDGMANAETARIHLVSLAEGASLTPYRGGLDSPNLLDSDTASAEQSIGTWTPLSNCTIAQVTDIGNTAAGTGILRLTAAAAGEVAVATGGASNPHAVTAGEPYTVLASLRAHAASRTGRLVISWYDDNGYTGKQVFSGVTNLTNNAWVALPALTVIVPAGITNATVEVHGVGLAAGEFLDVDAVSFAHGTGSAWKPGMGVERQPMVEYSDDDEVTWQWVRQVTFTPYDPVTRLATVYDYEAPPNTERKYRARTSVNDPWTPAELLSEPSDSVAATLPNDLWLLKDPLANAPGLVVSQRGDLDMTASTSQEVAEVQGRSTAVVLSDVPGGESLSLSLTVQGNDDWVAFEKMRKIGHALLLQSDMTDQWYVIFTGDRKATLLYTSSRKENPARVVEVTAVEVERP